MPDFVRPCPERHSTIEIPQRARTFKANSCWKVHNVHLKLVSPISG